MSDLLRPKHGKGHEKVTSIELFFDLVFVFAVTQVSHKLMGDFSVLGGVQALMMMFATWWLWIYTSWFTNWLDPEKIPVRLAVLALMLLGLIFSASLPTGFSARGWYFAGAYVVSNVGRSLFFLWATRGHETMVRNFQRILVWQVASGSLWMTGAALDGWQRLWLWGAALVLDMISASVGFFVPGLGKSASRDWEVEGAHMAERCGCFIIIALGESVLVTGAIFADLQWTAATVGAFVSSFLGSIAMWWLYFAISAEVGSRKISGSKDPGRLARLAYTYLHLFLVAGIIVAAVGDEFVLHHPMGHADAKVTVTVLGSTALYLIGNALFKWAIAGGFAISHGVALVILGALAFVAPAMSPLMLSGAATLVMIGTAFVEWRSGCLTGELVAEVE